jgi:hypothetical protein
VLENKVGTSKRIHGNLQSREMGLFAGSQAVALSGEFVILCYNIPEQIFRRLSLMSKLIKSVPENHQKSCIIKIDFHFFYEKRDKNTRLVHIRAPFP